MGIRKNARNLTTQEKHEFVNAVLNVKRNGFWDRHTLVHSQMSVVMTPQGSTRSQPHGGPAFLVWHRYYTYLLEVELQRASGNPDLSIPYWDWTQDAANPSASPIWSSDFMGGDGDSSDQSYVVKTGPFRFGNWTCINDAGNPIRYADGRFSGGLKRRLGNDIASLPSSVNVDNAVNIRTYDTSPWSSASTGSHRNALEGFTNSPQLHNRVHRWIGQTMRTNVAPNDPLFFLHHSMVDRIFARWQADNGLSNYLPSSNGPYRHQIDDPMLPWNVTPRFTLNYSTNLRYTYDSLR